MTAYILVAETGSDPVVAEKLGLKTSQIDGIRDPEKGLVEKLQADPDRIKDLARKYLERVGQPVPAATP